MYRALGGNHPAPHFRPGSWDLVCEGELIVQLDEELHFNRYRAQTLDGDWAKDLPWTTPYKEQCTRFESLCMKAGRWGKRWTNPSTEKLFGEPASPGDLDGVGGAPRWKQRALYDCMKDMWALDQGVQLARISVHDRISDRTVEDALNEGSRSHDQAIVDLVAARRLHHP